MSVHGNEDWAEITTVINVILLICSVGMFFLAPLAVIGGAHNAAVELLLAAIYLGLMYKL